LELELGRFNHLTIDDQSTDVAANTSHIQGTRARSDSGTGRTTRLRVGLTWRP
jgi:hypothetical protein